MNTHICARSLFSLPHTQTHFTDSLWLIQVRWSRGNACKRKEQDHGRSERGNVSKKPRLVFTDVQRRTLHAIFKENKRPSKELQVTIAQQLGLELATVSNFFMNARRRSLDKWVDDGSGHSVNSGPNACTKAWRWTDLTNSWTDSTSVEKL